MGLRELKKEQTRLLISGTAWRLFADRGFDKVTVAEVAREAQVAEATVFNYFASKEDLFYERLGAFSARLTDAVSARPAGEPQGFLVGQDPPATSARRPARPSRCLRTAWAATPSSRQARPAWADAPRRG